MTSNKNKKPNKTDKKKGRTGPKHPKPVTGGPEREPNTDRPRCTCGGLADAEAPVAPVAREDHESEGHRWLDIRSRFVRVAAVGVRLRVRIKVTLNRTVPIDLRKLIPGLNTAVGANATFLAVAKLGLAMPGPGVAIAALISGVLIGATSTDKVSPTTWIAVAVTTSLSVVTGEATVAVVLVPLTVIGGVREICIHHR